MERKGFLRSLLMLAAAPEIIAELNIPMKVAPAPTRLLFNDLNLMVPHYYKQMMEKYGDSSFIDMMKALGEDNTPTNPFIYYEKES